MKIPVLSYNSAISANFEKAGHKFLEAMNNPGFLFLADIPGFDSKTLLHYTKLFYTRLSAEERNSLIAKPYRGYIAADPTAESSFKHHYEIGGIDEDRTTEFPLLDATPWPNNEPFVAFMQSYNKLMVEVSSNLLRMLALAVGKDPGEWLSMFLPNELSTLRLIHYPIRNGRPPVALMAGDQPLHCAAHTDTAFITLLATFGQPGLQILTKENAWMNAESDSESDGLFVNVGNMLVHLVGSGVKATEHRVLDLGVDRFSVPFFFEPNWDAEFEGKRYGITVIEKMAKYVEHGDMLEKLKQRPDYKLLIGGSE